VGYRFFVSQMQNAQVMQNVRRGGSRYKTIRIPISPKAMDADYDLFGFLEENAVVLSADSQTKHVESMFKRWQRTSRKRVIY
jgi:hypothetical protein